jgi:putative ABC transport system permease protein
MGIRVIAGRSFETSDDAGRPRVVVINEKLARHEFGDRSPVGTSVYVGSTPVLWRIVGVVQDVRQQGLDREPRPQVFADMRQWPSGVTGGVPIFPVGAYYSVRTTNPASVIANTRAIVKQQEPGAAIENIATMEQIVSNSVTVPRMYAVLLGIFAGVALTLAAAGIYGVVAYSVTQRTREIGIRMALGARRSQVLALVLRQSLVLVGLALVLGLAGAAAGTRYLEGLLFGLTPLGPPTFADVAIALALVAAAAAYIPARRATLVDPLEALRRE